MVEGAAGLPWSAWLLIAAAVALGPLIEIGFLLRLRRRRLARRDAND